MSVDFLYPLAADHLHPVTDEQLQQTFAESRITASASVGRLFVHHGFRFNAPIIIVEVKEPTDNDAHLVWYDETNTAAQQ